ncbi:beta-ketoacyl synthase N-terminal-like domain-containing protein [Streptomyces luomodiensis]|uniref:Beta-ketoacyl synthase N-terminal-like domain-containing protein n=1 Tax=Streptomyces luomodiensis TaxID=3026192 RepID=A0ABY9UXP9_9ACTN|nr:beta-ketoacyl synthase N-terminal-like domain-containing protein [Streptomyces sp. SCA4-21]WNE96787.1 beta-ketoacyl synthase N-terminal-like domain-containing protein [Streptomyces sp. SCA4-21]
MVNAAVGAAPVISAWTAVSPLGLRGADFTAALGSGRPAGRPLDPEEWSVPFREAGLVPDFHIRQILGRKGTRSMDRATGLAVTAIRHLLTGEREREQDEAERLPGVDERAGLALGTSTGSAQSIMDFTRDSLVGEKPFYVDPARFPNTVMNCAAGQSAIWHGLKGPNTTIAGGRATGLLALQYALRLQRAGRADAVLCGAVEEFSSARAWLEWHARADGDSADSAAVLGEGAAVWLLEPDASAREHGRAGLAEVAGLEFGCAADAAAARTVLAKVIGRLLDRTGVAPGELSVIADSGAPGAEGDAERAALTDVFGEQEPPRITAADIIGDTCAAAAAFQIATVLALAERQDIASGGTALVTTVDRDGVVGAALLRIR